MMLRIAKFGPSPFQLFPLHNLISERKENCSITAESILANVKRAKLSARKEERIMFPKFDNSGGDGGDKKSLCRFCDFLRHPSGIEAILNTSVLQSFQLLGSNIYRCTLPSVQLLNFEVAPILDMRVTPTAEDCMVELLSCKFEGSNVVERQNDRFSASMTNHITWDEDSDPYLNVDVKLNLVLEIYTQPFTLLPVSAVERPGNIMMQALLDRLVPSLLQQLLQDYGKWVHEQTKSRQEQT